MAKAKVKYKYPLMGTKKNARNCCNIMTLTLVMFLILTIATLMSEKKNFVYILQSF